MFKWSEEGRAHHRVTEDTEKKKTEKKHKKNKTSNFAISHRSYLLYVLCFLLCVLRDSVVNATPPPPVKALDAGNVLAALGGGSIDALAGSLRGVLVKSMPSPLYEDTRHWGGQKPVPEIKWRGKGVHVHPEKIEVM